MMPQLTLTVMLLATSLLLTGLALGWWLRGFANGNLKSEIARRVLDQMQSLTTSVADDLGKHRDNVLKINEELKGLHAPGDDLPNYDAIGDLVLGNIGKILVANQTLQEQLSTVEVRIERQTDEIRRHASLARIDPLTQLVNRQALGDELNRRFSEWERREIAFSLVIFEIDHFEELGKTRSQAATDDVLRGVARVLTEATRLMDLVARYDGNALAVVFPVTTLAEALRATERLQGAITAAPLRINDKQLRVTCSGGVAQVHDDVDKDSLLGRAGSALIAAKGAGQGQVFFHNGQVSMPIADGQSPASQPANDPSRVSMNPEVSALTEHPSPTVATAKSVPSEHPSPKVATAKSVIAEVPTNAATAPARPRPESGASTAAARSPAFRAAVHRLVEESQANERALSLVLVEIDGLETLVEHHGPAVRDVLETTLTDFLRAALGGDERVARQGEGRIGVAMPGTRLQEAGKVAERLRETIAATPMVCQGSTVRVTVAVGMAGLRQEDETDALFQRSESALAASKQAGGNCTHADTGEKRVCITQTPVAS